MMDSHGAIALYFRNLRCTTNNKEKVILNNLSGKFPSGSLIALMGPSGAGKTTLLNVLSAYARQNTTYTALQLNGRETHFEHLRNISCYLTQDIHLNDLLSVEENLLYGADLKLGEARSRQEKSKIVDELLDSFGLVAARRTRAGKLSGGERKRLALALEVISDPKIIFLDEPTTGLDISTTHQILTYLKKIAGTGKTVVCTIHQVCASHFDLFDFAYVIAEGQCAYQGRPQDLVQFLDVNGLPCNIYHSPADYLIELCSGDFGKDKVHRLVNASQNGGAHVHSNPRHSLSSCDGTSPITNSTWSNQFNTLLRREFVKIRRNCSLVHLRLFGTNLIALMLGVLFYDVGSDASKVFSNYYVFMTLPMNIMLSGLLYKIISYPSEMDVIKREIHNRYYSLMQYYLSVSILDLPISIVTMSSSNLLVYYLSGQPLEKDRIILFLIVTIAYGAIADAIGFFYGTLLKFNHAIFFGSATQIPFLLISGFGMLPQHLPKVLKIVSKVTYMQAVAHGFIITCFGLEPRKLHCPEEALYCFYRNTHRFLKDIEIDPFDYAWPLCVLFGWYVAFKVITFYLIRYKLSSPL